MPTCAFLIPGDLTLPTGGYIYDRRIMAVLPALGLDVKHVALPAAYPVPSQKDLDETADLVRGLAADSVLLIDGLAYGAMPPGLVRGFGRRIVALCHHPLYLETGLSDDQVRALKACEMAALELADAVIATSPMTRALLIREFGIPASRIHVAVPGTEPGPRSSGSAEVKGDDPTRTINLLAVGAVVPRKAYGVLASALATLDDLAWTLTIVGDTGRAPAETDRLRAQINDLALGERVTLTGAVNDRVLGEHYQRADLFVLPSLFEGYGMVLAEAMSRGLAIVCTTGGAVAETVPAGAALKVPPGDADALAGALRQAIGNEGLRSGLARAAWVAGQTLPRWTDTAAIIANVLRRVAA